MNIGPYDKEIDISVNVKAPSRAFEDFQEELSDVRNRLAEITGIADGAEDSIDDLNREFFEGAAGAGSMTSELGQLEATMMAVGATSEAVSDDFQDFFDDGEDMVEMFEEIEDALDGAWEDASPQDLLEAQHKAIQNMIEDPRHDFDRQELMDEFIGTPVEGTEDDPLGLNEMMEMEQDLGWERRVKEAKVMAHELRQIADRGDRAITPHEGEDGGFFTDDIWEEGGRMQGIFQREARDKSLPNNESMQDFLEYFEDFRQWFVTNGVGDPTQVADVQKLQNVEMEKFVKALRHFERQRLHEEGKDDTKTSPQRIGDFWDDEKGKINEWALEYDESIPGAVVKFLNNIASNDAFGEDDQDGHMALARLLTSNIDDSTTGTMSEDVLKAGDDHPALTARRWKEYRQGDVELRREEMEQEIQKDFPIDGLDDIIARVSSVQSEPEKPPLDDFEEWFDPDEQQGSMEMGIAEMLGVPTDKYKIAAKGGFSDKWLTDPGVIASRALGEGNIVEALVSSDTEPDRHEVVEKLREFLGDENTSETEASTFYNILEDMGGFAQLQSDGQAESTPFTTETVRSKLLEQYLKADREETQDQILDLVDKMETGAFEIRSLAESSKFEQDFKAQLGRFLQNTDIPDKAVDQVTANLASTFLEKAEEEGTYIEDLLGQPDEINKILDEAKQGMDELEEEGVNITEVLDAWTTQQDEILDAVVQTADETQKLYEVRAAPGARQALGLDKTPFGKIREREDGDRITENKGLAVVQRRQAEKEMEKMGMYGDQSGPFPGVVPGLFEATDKATQKLDELTEEYEVTSQTALKANQKLKDTKEALDKLVPTIGASSISLGPLNASLAKTGAFMYGLTALIGPLVTAFIGLAGAVATAGAALGSFVAIGGLVFLEQLQKSMAGVNSRAQAMQKLMTALKKDAMQAVAPLRQANLGGEGASGLDMFISGLKGALQILHQFAHVMTSIVELDEFQSFIESVTAALFSSDGGATMLETLRNGVKRLLPYLEGLIVFVINSAPEFISFVTDITDRIMIGWGPALEQLLPYLASAIKFGAQFIMIVGRLAGGVLFVVNAIGDLLGAMGPFGDIVGGLIRLLATLVAIEWAVSFASTVLGGVMTWLGDFAIVSAMESMWGFIATEVLATGTTWSLTGAVKALWAAITAHPLGALATALAAVIVGLTMLELTFPNVIDLGQYLIQTFDEIVTLVGLAAASMAGLVSGPLGALIYLLYDLSTEGGLLPQVVDWMEVFNAVVKEAGKWAGIIKRHVEDLIQMLTARKQQQQQQQQPHRRGPGTPMPVRGGAKSPTVVNNYQINANSSGPTGGRLPKEIRRELEKKEERKGRHSGNEGDWFPWF